MIKPFKGTLFFSLVLMGVSLFHFQLESFILKLTALNFVIYLIYGLFLAFFLVIFFKISRAGKNLEMGVLLLVTGLIFFFLFSNPRLLFKLEIFEFFLLGVLAALDNKKRKSLVPFIIILAVACLVELVTTLWSGTRFYYLDVWIHSLAGLSGYITGFLML